MAERPNVKLDLTPDAMTREERDEAVEVLRHALQILDSVGNAPKGSKFGRETESPGQILREDPPPSKIEQTGRGSKV